MSQQGKAARVREKSTFREDRRTTSLVQFLQEVKGDLTTAQAALKGDLTSAQAALKKDLAASQITLESRLAASQAALELRLAASQADLKQELSAAQADNEKNIRFIITSNNWKLMVGIASTSIAALTAFQSFGFTIGPPWSSTLLPSSK